MIELASTLLLFLGLAVPIATPIYLFCIGASKWATISIIATFLSGFLSTRTTWLLMYLQCITKSAIIANIAALIYHILLLTIVIIFAPAKIWWILILATWELDRHPLQGIMQQTQQPIISKPALYALDQTLSAKTTVYSGLQILITGIASIIASITLLLI